MNKTQEKSEVLTVWRWRYCASGFLRHVYL